MIKRRHQCSWARKFRSSRSCISSTWSLRGCTLLSGCAGWSPSPSAISPFPCSSCQDGLLWKMGYRLILSRWGSQLSTRLLAWVGLNQQGLTQIEKDDRSYCQNICNNEYNIPWIQHRLLLDSLLDEGEMAAVILKWNIVWHYYLFWE